MGILDYFRRAIGLTYSRATIGNYVYVPKSEITNLELLRSTLIVTSKYDPEKRIPIYYEDNERFGFPRYHFKHIENVASKLVDMRSDGHPIELVFNVKLWDYQQQAIDRFKLLKAQGVTGFFLGAKPGAGKTNMGIKMIQLIGQTALVVVPKKDLIHQWRDRFLRDTSLQASDIGILMAGKNDWFGKKVVIGTVHTIAKDKFGERFKDYFGTVVYDECDSTVPPKTFAPAAGMFHARYRIGMTASRDRADQTHIVFEKHIMEAEINCETSNTMTPTALFVEFKESSGEMPYGLKGIPRVGTLTSLLAQNHRRNALIAKYTFMSYGEGRPTLVISNRKEQLKELRGLLIQQGVLPHEIGYYTASIDGKTFKKEQLRANAATCKILLGTYGMIGRGTDIPRLSALVLATPQADLRQTKGRIERFITGKLQPIVIDIYDSHYIDTTNSAKKRYYQYLDSKMEVRIIDG